MQGVGNLDVMSVTTTVGSAEAAHALARIILEHRLGACVQIEPLLASHYHWQGARCQEPEVRLAIKTLPHCAAGLQMLFAEHHPYELPQFLAVTMHASEAYAEWVRAAVRSADENGESP
jgi:periplasmic divalent cation tolerance protein